MIESDENGDIEYGEIEAVEQQTQQEPQEPKIEVPEKFRGKNAEDLIKVISDQEKMIGRQAQEVGEVRKLADELLKSQFSAPVVKEKPKEVDFFENPQEAIRQAVDNNPRVLAAEQYARKLQEEQNARVFYGKHSDAQSIIASEDFINYVKASPLRVELYNRADKFDVNAADELLSNYKMAKSIKQAQGNEIAQAERSQAIKNVSVDTGGSGEVGKKVYSSAALRLLQIRDKAKYESMHDEILQAYREGRVR